MANEGKTTAPWEDLRGVLKTQRQAYEHLRDALKEKERLIIKGDVKKLEALVAAENRRVDELEEIERKRIAAVERCAGSGEQPTLTELLKMSPEDLRPAIENEALGLMTALNQAAALNRSNAELIRESVQYSNYSINVMTSGAARETVYEGTGRMKSAEDSLSGFLNRQV
ncbi:MAG: flagellar protein FlgN [bacterium]